jgi:hypothetical protein
VRISKESAASAKLVQELGLSVQVSSDKPLARTGAVHVQPLPVMASAGALAGAK